MGSRDLDEGMAHLQAGRWGPGVACLQRAVQEEPRFAEVWSNLGFGLRELGRLDEAADALHRAVALKPALADAWNLLGLVEQARGDHAAALERFARAIESRPDFAVAWMNRANSEHAMGRGPEALRGYERALAIEPRLVDAHLNAAHVHAAAGDRAAAIERFRAALRVNPREARAHLGLAHSLFLTGGSGSLEHFQEALRWGDDSVTAHIMTAGALFAAGRFDEGWREYGWRAPRRDYLASLAAKGLRYVLPPLAELSGRRVAIVGEQGLGDNVFFLRYATAVKEAGAALQYVGDPRLHALLMRTGVFASVADRAPSRDQELAILAADLPLLFPGEQASRLPPPLALSVDGGRLASARERLRALGPAPYVALTWRAGEPKEGELRLVKEIAPRALGEALRGVPATWISVQRGARDDELSALQGGLERPVHDLGAVNSDLDEALALMAAVDDYVGVSNTNMHLRAGVASRARVLVPFPAEWRWNAPGRSPWFASFDVYRAGGGSRWEEALARLAADLRRAQ
jgi:tetratricopeptide (TPR) repeat protein